MPNSRKHPDSKDLEILELLGEDASQTAIAIAEKLNLTPSTVRRRIKRLKVEGIIVKYAAIVDHARASDSTEAYLELHFHKRTDIIGFLQELVARREILEGTMIAGNIDALVRVRMPNTDRLKDLVEELRAHAVIDDAKTHVCLQRVPGLTAE